MNYRDVERRLNAIGDMFGTKVKTHDSYGYHTSEKNPFIGQNFITSSVVGIWKDKESGIYFELSYGRGMGDYYIYGVTFGDDKGMEDWKPLNKCCHEFSEVESTLESVLNDESDES